MRISDWSSDVCSSDLLVAGAKRPHEITVDQIYAVIQQGSRTTINDELKLWKDERTKIDALSADLPPAMADAMRSLWVAAVEQGARAFTEQREAMEIGSAPCRERGCRYGWVTGAAG